MQKSDDGPAKTQSDLVEGDTNLFGYVLNDPINFIDPLGQLRIEYDPKENVLTVIDMGDVIHQVEGFNNTDSKSKGPFPEGKLSNR